MTVAVVSALAEGPMDGAALRKVASTCGIEIPATKLKIAGSNQRFWKSAKKYNHAASQIGNSNSIFLGLGDQENPNNCSPGQLSEQLGIRSDFFIIRLSERMLENWLLSDISSLAKFLKIKEDLVRKEIYKQTNVHPKDIVVSLARRSKVREIKADVVPKQGSKGRVGKGYTAVMTRFIEDFWNPDAASVENRSLEKALLAIRRIAS